MKVRSNYTLALPIWGYCLHKYYAVSAVWAFITILRPSLNILFMTWDQSPLKKECWSTSNFYYTSFQFFFFFIVFFPSSSSYIFGEYCCLWMKAPIRYWWKKYKKEKIYNGVWKICRHSMHKDNQMNRQARMHTSDRNNSPSGDLKTLTIDSFKECMTVTNRCDWMFKSRQRKIFTLMLPLHAALTNDLFSLRKR